MFKSYINHKGHQADFANYAARLLTTIRVMMRYLRSISQIHKQIT